MPAPRKRRQRRRQTCNVIVLEDEMTFIEDVDVAADGQGDVAKGANDVNKDQAMTITLHADDDFLEDERDYEQHTISWVETRVPKINGMTLQ